MTTTSVKDVGSVMNLGAAAGVGVTKSAGASFQDVWSSQAGKGNAPQPGAGRETQDPGKTARTDKTAKPGEGFKSTDRSTVRMNRNAETADSAQRKDPGDLSEEELAEAMEVVASAAMELIRQIADTFGMSPEEVQALMTDLDLQPSDLLQPENLSDLLLEAGGVQDSLALLTDEKLYGDFRAIMEQGRSALEQASEDLRMKPEQLLEMIRSAGAEEAESELAAPELYGEVQMPEDKAGTPDRARTRTEDGEPVIEIAVQTEKPEKETELKPRTKNETEAVRQEPDRQDIQAQGTPGEEKLQAAGREQPTGRDASQDGKDGREHSGHGRPEGDPVMQAIRNEEFQPQPENVQEAPKTWSADTQDLMRQIMDYMRIQVREDVSNLEMQLHPASLGTLQIQVMSRGGVLTANFITQNESVKAALESQMAQLKESFEEQGVKVEAIEVTVQTHEFEQNLEQGRGRQPQGSGEKKNRTRRITLDALGAAEGSEELEEADRLTARMMAADGNTVDYTA